ncbi:MAG: DUF4404 family protein [Xanthomonadales bacterium]|nr:DUF4404 family protein [Xanthomonadales bacterium]
MEDKQLQDLLARLHDELENTDEVDPETLRLVRELDEEINRLVDPHSDDHDFASAIDRAKSIQARFAADHPVADRFLREIMDTLAKVGI